MVVLVVVVGAEFAPVDIGHGRLAVLPGTENLKV